MILETLRKEIEMCGKSRYVVSQESGVSEPQLTRLMQGQGFRCQTADTLLSYFGYELKKRKGARK